MARKLAANVYVGETLYRAGTSPEKEIADQITNPKAWGEVAEDEAPAAPAAPPAPPAGGGDDSGTTEAPAPAKKAATPRKRTSAKKTAPSK